MKFIFREHRFISPVYCFFTAEQHFVKYASFQLCV